MKRLFYIFVFFLVSLSVMGAKIPSGTKLYLKPTETWNNSGAWFAAYFYGDGDAWVKMEDKDGDGIFSCITPNSGKNYTNVIFVRMSSTNQSLNWGAKWNQTSDLTYDGSKNLYTITGWNGNQGKGSWSVAGTSIMYFAKQEAWEKDTVNFMQGHDSWSGGYLMEIIPNTKLYFIDVQLWTDYKEWAIFCEDVQWGGEGKKIVDRAGYVQNLCTTSVATEKLDAINLLKNGSHEKLSSYTDLNHTHTINITTDDKASTTGGTITVSSYNLTAENTASSTKGSASGTKTTISVVYTATVTLEATAKPGYSFLGWFNGLTKLSSEKDYSYIAENSDKTLTAKFKINTYTITATAGDGGSVTGDGSYDYNKTATLTATADRGYKFIRWSDDNIDNPRKFTVTKDATYTAVFDKLCEYDELAEKTTYYVRASTIEVANKYENEKVEGVETVVDGVYSITIPSTSVYDRLVLDDKTFNTSQITTQYYNGSEWLYCDIENVLNLSDEPQRGLYGIINFQKTISGDDINKWHWISLPYNVKISDINVKINDIQGGVYGTDFIIQEYDSKVRAQWTSIKSSENKDKVTWKELDEKETLMAGKGYILAVDGERGDSWNLIFKSANALNVVEETHNGVNIDYISSVAGNSNWHLIGTGVYGNAGGYENVNYVAKPDATGADYTYHFLGEKPTSNFNPTSLGVDALEPYTAFFVQHGGGYSFSKAQPAQNAAPRRARAEEGVEQYYVNIAGMADSSYTAIFLAEDGSDDYVVGQDFLHLGASGASLQLYSLQGESTLSFNYLERRERTIALGGYVAEAGKYTISLTADGKASSVILYDSQTGEATDLLQYDYEFDAEKGYLDGRFDITIAYAAQDDTPTDVEIGGNDRLVVLNSDGIVTFEGLAIGEEVVIYDIMGRCVSHFVASDDVVNVMLADGVYVMKHSSEIIKFVVNR